MNYITKRLQERSTWAGLILLATSFGANITPELQEAIIAIGVGVAGLVSAILPDSLSHEQG